MAHSPIAPSGASVWGKEGGCTGSVSMMQQYPDLLDSIEAQEGEAAHEIAETLVTQASRGVTTTTFEFFRGKFAKNNIPFNEEMYQSAIEYANDVIKVMRDSHVFGGDNLGIEQRIIMPLIHDESYGTPDMFLYDKKQGVIYIWDFKYGHLVVEAFENWQMISYLAGIQTLLDINGATAQHTVVKIRVIQPRAFHHDGVIREWSTMLANLRGYWNILHTNAHLALSDDATLHTGSHCKYCSARHVCKPALDAGMSYYEYGGQVVPVELSPTALGLQLTMINRGIEALKLLQTGYSEQVRSLVQQGTIVLGHKVVNGKGRLKWDKPVAEILALGDLMGHDLRKPESTVITPSAAKKLGIDETVISLYSVTPSTGIKIVPDDGSKARQTFGD